MSPASELELETEELRFDLMLCLVYIKHESRPQLFQKIYMEEFMEYRALH